MSAKTLFIAISSLLSSSLAAQAAACIQQFENWAVYSDQSKSGAIGYALSMPKSMEPVGIDHGTNYFLVSPEEGGKNGFTTEAVRGYSLKPGAPITLTVDHQSFSMVSKDNAAWLRQEKQDFVVVKAMEAGEDMMVSATSELGTATRYSYSLSGSSAALKKVSSCR